MTYPEPNFSTNGLPDMFLYANQVTGGSAVMVLIGAIWAIIVISLFPFVENKIKAFLAATFFCAVISGILFFTGMVPDYFAWTFALGTFALTFLWYFTKEDV